MRNLSATFPAFVRVCPAGTTGFQDYIRPDGAAGHRRGPDRVPSGRSVPGTGRLRCVEVVHDLLEAVASEGEEENQRLCPDAVQGVLGLGGG